MRSIRARVLAAVLGLLGAAALLIGALTYRGVHAEVETLFDYQLRQMALSLRDQGEVAPAQAAALADGQLDFVVQIWTADGRAIYAPRPHAQLPLRAQLGLADVSVGGATWRSYTVATPSRVIQVAQPLAVRRRLAAEAAWRSVWPLLLVAPLLGAAAWWGTMHALAPLERLAGALRRRDAASLAPLPESGLPDELAPLVAALNTLLQRLAAALDAQRSFVADAAHELRSPLTALKLQLQQLKRAPDDARRAAAVEALAGGIERAARLVEQLLALARSEPGAAVAPLLALDLGETARAALAEVAPLAAARGAQIELLADEPVWIDGDRAGLQALVRNLADNAVRHGGAAARVEVRVRRDGAQAELCVDDNGPGIEPAQRAQAFGRFVRGVGGGQPGEGAEGSGLGLAIVRSIAERHGGHAALEESPLGGLRVRVRLPGGAAAATTPGDNP
ncbi:MAG TPA: ATP-binding protein [Rubrivivax sp.]|nr:ATP-binding protein [Rubrivivax sp.]